MKGRISSPIWDGSSRKCVTVRDPKPDLRKPFRIATWNVLSLNGTGYVTALVNMLAKYSVDVAGITEARLPHHDLRVVQGSTIMHSGGDDHTKGVALIIRPQFANAMTTWRPISSRLLYARFAHLRGHLSIVVAYAPTEEGTESEKDLFYDQLAATILAVPPHDELVVLGDMNASTGPRVKGFEDIMGPYGLGTANDNTHRLLGLCSSMGLVIPSTWFRRREIHRLTWSSNDHRTKKELDHILTRSLDHIKGYRVYRGAAAPANTDHFLLVANFAIRLRPHYKCKRKPAYNIQLLREDQDAQLAFATSLADSLLAAEIPPADVETAWNCIKCAIHDSAAKSIGYRKAYRKPWLSVDTMAVLDAKAKARLNGNLCELKRLQGIFKAKAKRDKNNYYQSLADNVEEGMSRNNLSSAYRAIHQIRGSSRGSRIPAVLSGDGSPCSGQGEALSRWREFFTEALNHPSAVVCPDLYGSQDQTSEDEDSVATEIESNAPSLVEVINAIHKLKLGRAAGPDDIPPELLRGAVGPISIALHSLFARIWSTDHVPKEWKEGVILALYKGKGSKSECSSYRPITLLSVPGKVFAHVLLARMNPLLVSCRRPEQSGFTAGRSAMDAILSLRLITEIHREFHRPLLALYVDIKSAFDSVDRSALWRILRIIGVPPKLVHLVESLHVDTSAKVRVNDVLTDSFPTTSGVRQGCVLAPALFCCAMDWILRRIPSLRGVQLLDQKITDFDYADDVVFVDNQTSSLADCLTQFEKEASHLGLHTSWQKTKLQVLCQEGACVPMQVCGHDIDIVQEFTYLGSIQDSDGRCSRDIARRIGLASSAMRSMQRLWSQRSISLVTKLRIYQTCVLPVLLYSAETWTLLSQDLQRLQSFHMRSQRQILQIRWYDFITNGEVIRRTGMETIANIIDRRRHALFGHVVRLDSKVPAHGVLACAVARRTERRPPPGWNRRPGRPRRVWLQQCFNGSSSAILSNWNSATSRGHTRSAQRALAVHAN